MIIDKNGKQCKYLPQIALRYRDKQSKQGRAGFTLVELIIVTAIIGVLASMAMPAFSEYMTKAKNAKCIGDMSTLDRDIQSYYIDKNAYPDTLTDVNRTGMKDPWGTDYQYARIADPADALEGTLGLPLNAGYDYDLYSKGPNATTGASVAYDPLTSYDDIVRANGSSFFGLRKFY